LIIAPQYYAKKKLKGESGKAKGIRKKGFAFATAQRND
jgi:hypothetical protein